MKEIKNPGYLYAIQDSQGKIKVGKTKNKKQRLTALQTAHADDLTTLYWLAVDDMVQAERSAHTILAPWRKDREWFVFDRMGMIELQKVFNIISVSDVAHKQLRGLGLRKE